MFPQRLGGYLTNGLAAGGCQLPESYAYRYDFRKIIEIDPLWHAVASAASSDNISYGFLRQYLWHPVVASFLV